MLYYKIAVSWSEPETEETNLLRKRRNNDRAITQQIQKRIREYNAKRRDRTVFLVALQDSGWDLVAVSRSRISRRWVVLEFDGIGRFDLEFDLSELTFCGFARLLQRAERNRLLPDADQLLRWLSLDQLSGLAGEREFFDEGMLTGPRSQKTLTGIAQSSLSPSLEKEIRRIFAHPAGRFVGRPVHYLIEADTLEEGKKLFGPLLEALYRANRLQSRRYALVNLVNPAAEPPRQLPYDQLGKHAAGGAMVVWVNGEGEHLNDLLPLMQRFQDDTLFLLCLPKRCDRVKETLVAAAETMTFVGIRQDIVSGDRVQNYLKARAAEKKLVPDASLYGEAVHSGKGFSAQELDRIFERWFHTTLRTMVYPQYAALEHPQQRPAAEKAQGSAYKELQQMVGLATVKQQIDSILHYYQAQQLFRDRGFVADRPAMHLVFTGNPGTAKTTVARLFAKILKENGLLSEGKLYEVGRADLVGEYVGWTARIVRKIFRQAKGSVLLIDEAYALWDAHRGSYGDEAINTMVQEMEHHREDLVVIFAGYPDEMERFLSRNPGMRSRIAFHLSFEDYSAEELYEITALLAKKSHSILGEGVREKLLPAFRTAAEEPDFGNGRFARKLLEQARMHQADRLLRTDPDRVTRADVTTLLPEDFELPAARKRPGFKLGFAG